MSKPNPFKIVAQFEEAVAEYTGAPFAVAVDSCTNAIFLSCKYLNVEEVTIPARTYVSVPNSIIHAGGTIRFRDYEWQGIYQLEPYPIWDCAKRFTPEMYQPGRMMCISFQASKILGIGKGGMILTDDLDAYLWLKKARFNGRSEVPLVEDSYDSLGWNMYMTPEQAARGLWNLHYLDEHNADQPCDDFADLSQFPVFTNHMSPTLDDRVAS